MLEEHKQVRDLQNKYGLRPSEARVLLCLLQSSGEYCPAEQIHHAISLGVITEPGIVKVIICRLRKKLAEHGMAVKVGYRRGYTLVAGEQVAA